MYLTKLLKKFQIEKYICLNWQMYLSKLNNIFVKHNKCIWLNWQIFIYHFKYNIQRNIFFWYLFSSTLSWKDIHIWNKTISMFHWDHFGIWWQNMFETNVFFHFPSNEMFPLIPWQIIFDRNNLFSLSQQEFVSTNLKTSRYKFTFCQFYSGDNKLEYKLQFCVVSPMRHKSWRKYDLNKSLTFCSIFLKSQILLPNF